MMRAIVAASAALVMLPVAASAQTADVQVYDTYPTTQGYAPGVVYQPPVYGYYQEQDAVPEVVVRAPTFPRNGCGEFRYWNGERCLDARWVAPDVR